MSFPFRPGFSLQVFNKAKLLTLDSIASSRSCTKQMESDPNFRPVRDWHWRNDARPKNDEERWDLFGRGMGIFTNWLGKGGTSNKLWNQHFKCQLFFNSDFWWIRLDIVWPLFGDPVCCCATSNDCTLHSSQLPAMRLPQRLCWCMDPAAQVLELLQPQKLQMVQVWHPPSNSGKCRLQVSPTFHVVILLGDCYWEGGQAARPNGIVWCITENETSSLHIDWITQFFSKSIIPCPAFRPCTKEKRPQAILPPPPSVTIWFTQQIRMTSTHSKWILQKSEFPYHKHHPQRYLWVSSPTLLEVDWPHTWQDHQQTGKGDSCKSGWRTRPRGCSSRCWLCSHLELKPRQAAQKLRVTCSMTVIPGRLIDLGASSNSGTNYEISCMWKMLFLNVLIL